MKNPFSAFFWTIFQKKCLSWGSLDIRSTKIKIYLKMLPEIGKKMDIYFSKNVLSEINLPSSENDKNSDFYNFSWLIWWLLQPMQRPYSQQIINWDVSGGLCTAWFFKKCILWLEKFQSFSSPYFFVLFGITDIHTILKRCMSQLNTSFVPR